MLDKYLHIIAFDIPYPPNYGGVIDVYYKLKALYSKGIKIILHCYEYPGRDRANELNKYCEEVFYYSRKLGLKSALSFKPYIVSSRRSKRLLENLLKDNYPILFEGLHSCYYIDHKKLRNRKKIYRESNIEHRYYYNLFRVDKNFFKKGYFLMASLKLRFYQRILKHANLMLVVSQEDTTYLQEHFPENQVSYLPSFHANNKIDINAGRGDYALYNGNIEVPENAHAVKYLIKEVFNETEFPLIVAGMNPPSYIQKLAALHPNVSLIANPDDNHMFDLIKNAQVNILVTFQATGLKLKLLNTLYRGRFCLVNDKMLNGTGLEPICEVGNNAEDLKRCLGEIFNKELKSDEIAKREEILYARYSNQKNAEKLIDLIFE
ncbi:MAG: glycosyltransferase family 1 protein [Bacteroidales bacterium]|nr:glycosyltransferase family 1 protein [Bacteroidales bacterium]MCF8404398.1 glycosyltransferase family 1 protein [Bacteroidales bacterium]